MPASDARPPVTPPSSARLLLSPLLAGTCLWALAACRYPYPQRLPEPLFVPEERAPRSAPVATAHVTLQRDSDPVWIRHAGERGEVAVPFYEKRQRIPVGTLVRTGAGGRAEILWGSDATSLVLFDEGRATVGDPEANEPVLRLHTVTHALLGLTPEDVVELPGGLRLSGDPSELTGPFFLERVGPILRLTNQSKRVATLAYRSQRGELGPGESVDLPLLRGGTSPHEEPPERLQEAGVVVLFEGQLAHEAGAPGLLLRATEPSLVQALGIQVRLEPGQSARFSLLSLGSPELPADPSPVPEPERD